jgi:NAD(P)-dependent dehydrogenase (short-subunit alcohol dehydrogenase family)
LNAYWSCGFVNNAGIAIEIDSLPESAAGQGVHLTPVSVYDKTMRVNARGTFLGCKYAIGQMMKQDPHPSGDRGWIINLSSVAGLVGIGGCRGFSQYLILYLNN